MGSRGYTEKIFAVGNNKTGTTSLQRFMSNLGYTVGNQGRTEDVAFKHRDSLVSNDFWRDLILEIETAQFFQDVPFSNPTILRQLVRRYPTACFVYTRRKAHSWYQSLVRHHARAAGFQISVDGSGVVQFDPLEVLEKLKAWKYRGFMGLDLVSQHFGFDVSEAPYERDRFIAFHLRHQENAMKILANYRAIFVDLVEEPVVAVAQLVDFLGRSQDTADDSLSMPHLNRAEE